MKVRLYMIFLTLCCIRTYDTVAQTNLPDFLNLSYTNSPLINNNKNQVVINQAEAERIRAVATKFLLSLSANYLFAPVYVTDAGHKGFDFNSTSAAHYYGFDLGNTNGGSMQGLVTIYQPLFAGKRADILGEQSRINARINTNTINLTRHDLEKTITDQYILCILDKKQIRNSSENMKLIDQQRMIVKKLVNASLLKSSDLILLNIEYENNENVLLTYQAAYHRDLQELRIATGSRDTAAIELDSLQLTLTKTPQQSAYLESFKLDSLNLIATQKAFETRYRPQLSLFGNGGLNGTHYHTLPHRFGTSGGINFTWNILDGNQKAITRRKTRIQLQTVEFSKKNAEFQYNLHRTEALDELKSYDERLKNQQNQLKEYESLLHSYRTQVIQAQLSVIDFINVLKNRTTAQRDLLQLETNRNLLINAYNYWNW